MIGTKPSTRAIETGFTVTVVSTSDTIKGRLRAAP